MKVFIDTNVILDVLYKRKDFYEDSLKVWKLCETRQIDGYISALSIPNIVYVLRKEIDPIKTLEVIKSIDLIFNIYDLKKDVIMEAAHAKSDDFEDAIQAVTASKVKAEYIITRNVKDYKNSTIKAIEPSELVKNY